MTSRVEAEGNSIDEAIEKALAELGIPREQARVEILQDVKRGLLGFGGQKARVVVMRRPAAGEESVVSSADAGDPAEVLRGLLERMDFEASVATVPGPEDGSLVLQVATEASALLIGRHGQTLDALEYLVNRIAGRHDERGSRIVVDCENYRERHQQELRETALRIAEKVRQRGKPQTMVPMTPRDRRIVHVALSAENGIQTRSVGQGYLRRVVITPARGARSAPRASS